MDAPPSIVIVAAHNEADRLAGDARRARASAFPGARVVVADDGSRDGTAAVARGAPAPRSCAPPRDDRQGRRDDRCGAQRVLRRAPTPDPPVVVLCDGDLGAQRRAAARAACDAVRAGEADLAVAAFARARRRRLRRRRRASRAGRSGG